MDREFMDDTLLDDELLPEDLYTSQVAQIRAKENTLLSDQDLANLLAAANADECIQLLLDRGWGPTANNTPEELIREEKNRCWDLLKDMCTPQQMHFFDIFRYKKDYHNLKAAIKEAYVQKEVPDIYIDRGSIPVEKLRKCAADNDFSVLSFPMMKAAEEARDILFHAGDSQLCDCIIDRAALLEMFRIGKESGNSLLKEYGELQCASADINIAIRACKGGKDADFLQKAFVECDSMSVPRLITATCSGLEAVYEYLNSTAYADAVPEIQKSAVAFDKWCDDRLIKLIQPQKYNAFTISPLLAYLIAVEIEIKSVRYILSGKVNDLPDEQIRERLRESYV